MKLQPLSKKQRDFLLHSDARLNIAFGSVRSGKTLVSLLRWLYIVATAPEGANLLIAGKTERTVRRNILSLIQDLVSPAEFNINYGVGECTIYGRRVYLVGANDERAENKIRGMSLYAAYCDELTLFPESFVQMLLSRLSDKNAILIATTNPDSPYHYVKTKFLDRVKDLNLKYWQFHLEDNKTLPTDYISDLKSEYVPGTVWYKRYILGEFALAEGAVFPFLSTDPKDGYVLDSLPNDLTTWLVAADYGLQHYTVFALCGYSASLQRWIVVKEWFTRDKTNTVYSAEFKREILEYNGGVPILEVNIDPGGGGLSLTREFESDYPNISTSSAVKKDVSKELQDLATGLFTHKISLYGPGCQHGLEQLLNYTWDDKAKNRGLDQPLKQNDDFCDALRYLYQMCLRYS
jgi:PBSX family phage terminase large subunit